MSFSERIIFRFQVVDSNDAEIDFVPYILPDMDLYSIIPCHPLIIKVEEDDSHV